MKTHEFNQLIYFQKRHSKVLGMTLKLTTSEGRPNKNCEIGAFLRTVSLDGQPVYLCFRHLPFGGCFGVKDNAKARNAKRSYGQHIGTPGTADLFDLEAEESHGIRDGTFQSFRIRRINRSGLKFLRDEFSWEGQYFQWRRGVFISSIGRMALFDRYGRPRLGANRLSRELPDATF